MSLFSKIKKSTIRMADGCYTAKSSSFFTDILGDTLPSPYSEEANRAISSKLASKRSKFSHDSVAKLTSEEAFAEYVACYSVENGSLFEPNLVSWGEDRLPAPHTEKARKLDWLSAQGKSLSFRRHWQRTYVKEYVKQVEKAKAVRESSAAHEEEKAKAARESSAAHEEEKAKVVHESSPVHEEETSSSQGLKEEPQP